jgi:hypothetical protein
MIAWNKTNGYGEVDMINLSGSGADGGFAFYDRDLQLMRMTKGGNVGIGTGFPAADLDIGGFNSGGALRNVFARLPEGNTTGPGTFLGVRAWSTQSASYNGKMFSLEQSFYGSTNSAINFYRGGSTTGGYIRFATNNGTEQVVIDQSGNVGIGTMSPQYPLAVNGTIQAKEVLVNTGWSDYVFDPGYRLQPLSEVATYVQENHHLPEIPSAAEVAEKGISLGDMQSKLLAKVEELTLHMIQAEKENHELKERLVRLEQSKAPVNQ